MKIIYKSLTIFISIIIGLIISELFLRIYGKYNDLSKNELVMSSSLYEKPKSSTLINKHPDLNILIENKFDKNSIRNHNQINTEDKKNIVAFFGDSHTENINISNEFQFITLLDNFFKEKNFVNYGVGGYSLDQIFIRYLNFQKHDIDHVYYVFCSNDAAPSIVRNNLIKYKNDNDYEILKPKFNLFERIIGKLNLTYFVIDIYYNLRAKIYKKHTNIDISNYSKKLAEKLYYKSLSRKSFASGNLDNLNLFNKVLKSFKNEVIKNNANFSIIILPLEEENIFFEKMIDNKEDYNIINLYTTYKKISDNLKDKIIFKNDSHMNEYGNLLVYQFLKELILNKKISKKFKFENDIKIKIDNRNILSFFKKIMKQKSVFLKFG